MKTGDVLRFLILVSVCTFAIANDAMLIKDMETVRNSLPFKDAGKPLLTRRLADLHFQEAITIEKEGTLKGKVDEKKVSFHRSRAKQLYQESIDGEKGAYPVATGELKWKIVFQLARIQRSEGKKAEALKSFEEIFSQKEIDDNLRRETTLTLAEMQEEDGKWQEAHGYYVKALPLCRTPEMVSYAYYRLAWANYRAGNIKEAQTDMEKALWDGQGQIKDQALADYIQFLSVTPQSDGQNELLKIQTLAQRISRPQIIETMAEAFFAAGNRQAGVRAMAYIHRQKPNLYYGARLAEEYYGFRDWNSMSAELETMSGITGTLAQLQPKQKETVDQILRRLVVQLDGERKSQNGQFAQEVCQSIDLHLALFPQSDVVPKMRQGWLAAQGDDELKIKRLETWIADVQKTKNSVEEMRWRQERAALSQKLKRFDTLYTDAAVLAKLSTDEAKSREWSYIAAKALQDQNKEREALEAYKAIAAYPILKKTTPDKWAIQAQNLALDILNNQKNYDGIVALATPWINHPQFAQNADLKDEWQSIQKINDEAQFEKATALGETAAALALFRDFCVQGKFTDKSCPNAKVLAVKLQSQGDLVKILEASQDQESLSNEFERMGRFKEAAALREKKLTADKTDMDWVQVALLYQIADAPADRTRVLTGLAQKIKRAKKMDPAIEPVLMTTFVESQVATAEIMSLPWTAETRSTLAARLEENNRGDASTKKILASSVNDNGVAWCLVTLDRLEALDIAQKKQSFYGQNSKARFQIRLKKLGQFAQDTKAVLPGARLEMQAYLLGQLRKAYEGLDQEIMNTPIPPELSAQAEQVKAAMAEVAAPFKAEATSYADLETQQWGKITDATWKTAADGGMENFKMKLQESNPRRAVAAVPSDKARQEALMTLEKNPSASQALQTLRDFHTARDEKGPSAYFSGRLSDLAGKI